MYIYIHHHPKNTLNVVELKAYKIEIDRGYVTENIIHSTRNDTYTQLESIVEKIFKEESSKYEVIHETVCYHPRWYETYVVFKERPNEKIPLVVSNKGNE